MLRQFQWNASTKFDKFHIQDHVSTGSMNANK
jgi:hypothetical protein